LRRAWILAAALALAGCGEEIGGNGEPDLSACDDTATKPDCGSGPESRVVCIDGVWRCQDIFLIHDMARSHDLASSD
jgi:hypothetical protein